MQGAFDQLVLALYTPSLSTDLLDEITGLLQQHIDNNLSNFVSQSVSSFVILERWVWELFSQESRTWLYVSSYQRLLQTLALFNKSLIFTNNDIDVETKASLLFTVNIEQVNNIFHSIDSSTNDNDPFITFIGLWLDNHSYLFFDNPQCLSPISDYIGDYTVKKYVLSKQYRLYLTQLRQPNLPRSIFTAKFLFYIQVCSLYFSLYVTRNIRNLAYIASDIIGLLHEDYIDIIHIHSYTVESWSNELIRSIAHLIGLVAGSALWNGENQTRMKSIFTTDKVALNHAEDLIRIVSYKTFYKTAKSSRWNDETLLISSILAVLTTLMHRGDIDWFFRSNTIVRDTVVRIVEAGISDEITLFGYSILGEILTDEEWKDLKIADNVCNYFIYILEDAWERSPEKYTHVPMTYMLRGFYILSKNDSIQQKMADSDKMHLLMAMCEEYPIVYDIIWTLSFNQDIQQQLRSKTSFLSKLARQVQQCDNEQIRKAAQGILWNLEIRHESHISLETIEEKKFDIMISYSHKEKALCKQIYDELTKAGYRIWIDFDQMHGNVMDAMAQAIEQSTTVIICMSEQYRKSNYCRAEAQYAFQRERKIVPILLQKHYKPDGWLLFLIGQLLYVDFNKYEFPRAMEMLFKELKIKSNSKPQLEKTVLPKEDINVVNPEVPVSSSSNMIEWTKAKVQDWLLEHNLVQMSRLLKDFDGSSLIYLSKYMKHCSSQQILCMLEADALRSLSERVSLIELCRFRSLIDERRKILQSTHRQDVDEKDCRSTVAIVNSRKRSTS